ncbi:PIG-L family deacetylase, partial [Candidatus Binatia bacterium]|nr:PIG-L family deacetylase [Candidatus Binatia bacterium]
LGAGGLVQRVLARGGTVNVVLVTAGDGYPDAVRGATGLAVPAASDYVAYGARRIAETRAALEALGEGAGQVHVTVLGFPDGVLASLRREHWSAAAPARSPTTGALDPPYDGLVADDAVPYSGAALLDALTRVVRIVRPTLVALPDPLDVHDDHATTGLFALAALADARSDARILAYLVHWPAWPPGWDAAASDASLAARGLDLPEDLPLRGGRAVLALSPAELAVKRRALARHATQQRQMASYLDAFLRPREPYSLLAPGDADDARQTLRAAPAGR